MQFNLFENIPNVPFFMFVLFRFCIFSECMAIVTYILQIKKIYQSECTYLFNIADFFVYSGESFWNSNPQNFLKFFFISGA